MAKLSDLLSKAASDASTITRGDLQSILRNCADIALRLEAKTAEVSDVRQSEDQLKSDWRHAVFNHETEKSFQEWLDDVKERQINDLVNALFVGTNGTLATPTYKQWASRMHHHGYVITRVESDVE